MTTVREGRFGALGELDKLTRDDYHTLDLDSRVRFLENWCSRLSRLQDVAQRDVGMAKLRTLTGLSLAAIRLQVHEERKRQWESNAGEGQGEPIRAVFEDAPCPEALEIPPDVVLTDFGTEVTKVKNGPGGPQTYNQVVTFVPIFLGSRVRRLEGASAEELEVIWKRDGAWQSVALPRQTVFDSRQLLRGLAPYGVPFTDSESRGLVEYFARFENYNRSNLTTISAITRSGWHDTPEGRRIFALGETNFGTTERIRLVCDPQEQENLRLLRKADNSSEADWSEGFSRVYSKVYEYNEKVRSRHSPNRATLLPFTVYACLAAPLLKPTHTDNFIFHLGGDSTGGKTTAARLGASVYGVAHGDRNLIPAWDGTLNSVQGQAKLFNDLPVFLDDSQTNNKDDLQAAIYRLANGVDRGRLKRDGSMAERKTWRCIIISTGEQNLSDSATRTGAIARIISLWGGPIHGDNKPLGDEVNSFSRENYGVIGPKWIEYVMELLDSDPEEITQKAVATCADELYQHVAPTIEKSARLSILGRALVYFGVVLLAARLAHRRFEWGWDPLPVVLEVLRLAIDAYIDKADISRQAHEEIVAWIHANRTNFEGGHYDDERPSDGSSPRPPFRGWLGKWEHSKGWTGVDKTVLCEELTRRRYDATAVLRMWADREWIRRDGRHMTTNVRLGGHVSRLVVVNRYPDGGPIS
jgi:hypothetical protein